MDYQLLVAVVAVADVVVVVAPATMAVCWEALARFHLDLVSSYWKQKQKQKQKQKLKMIFWYQWDYP